MPSNKSQQKRKDEILDDGSKLNFGNGNNFNFDNKISNNELKFENK